MKKNLLWKSKKGISLPMILIVITVVLSMVVTLLSLSVQQLKTIKSDNHIEHTYFAGDSMIEMTISKIYSFLDPTNLNSIPYNGYQDYAERICAGLNNEPDIVKSKKSINTGASGQQAISIVKSLDLVEVVLDDVNNKIRFKLRINTSTDYHTGYKSGSKETIAIKEFEVSVPVDKKPKLAAINSIGDLVATGAMESTITGDVKVYGSAPKEPVKVEQEFYGGIFSQRDAILRIEGNAFVRSFIRTGIKDDDRVNALNEIVPDNSRIYITKSAIAQGLHSFGYGSFIYVHKDAYTFDDVEMNAEDSAIIINRNLFALEDGAGTQGKFHDNSSAMVNSSPLYFLNSEGSLKSRIVVNGPVYLNGGTFRVNDNGLLLYPPLGLTALGDINYGQPQIEDGSIGWYMEEEAPYYTKFEDPNTDFIGKSYHAYMYDNDKDKVRGYGNLIQAFDQRTDDRDSAIKPFIDVMVKNAMKDGYSDAILSFIDRPSDKKIMGITDYEIAANGTMYFMDTNDESISGLKRPTSTAGNYSDAYLNYQKIHKNGSGYTKQQWIDDWNNAIDGTKDWDSLDQNAYTKIIPAIFNKLTGDNDTSGPLYELTEQFVKRTVTYPVGSAKAGVQHDLVTIPGESTNIFSSYNKELFDLESLNDPYFKNVSSEAGPVDLSTIANETDKYYVIYNNTPENDLIINSKINALIFTTGRVILRDGGDLRGCIIAAGKGYDGGVSGSQSEAGKIPKIDSTNYDYLNDGTFAGVKFEGSAKINFAPRDNDWSDPETAPDVFFEEFALSNSPALVSKLKTIFN